MIYIEQDYLDYVGVPIRIEDLNFLFRETLKSSKFCKHLDSKKIFLDVSVIDRKEIKRVNSEYRSKNSSTDVISIGEYSDDKDISKETKTEIFLGEILLSWDDIYENVDGKNVECEFFYVYIHGILHLLGYKHGDDMFSLQDDIIDRFCLSYS